MASKINTLKPNPPRPHKLALSAGIVPVLLEDEPLYLILRVYNYWDFPKGRVEPGEDALTAARRETREETTLVDLDFAWGETFIDTAPYGREKKVARYFVARTATAEISLPVNPALGRPEHHAWAWCDFETAEQRVTERLWPVLQFAQHLID